MTKKDEITPLPANADREQPEFDGEQIAETYRDRRADEAAAAPMETDGEAGGAANRGGTTSRDPAQPRADLPPLPPPGERDKVFPRKGRGAFLILLGAGLVVATAGAVLMA